MRGHLCVAVHRGKNLLVSSETVALLDPICRAETARMRAADAGWRRLLDHLAMAGPSDIEDLRVELGLKRQELKALRSPLERCGAIVSRSVEVTAGEGHSHSSELARWDQAYPGDGTGAAPAADPAEAFGDLLVAAVRAAVLAPEPELRRWFSWQWYWTEDPRGRPDPGGPPPPRGRPCHGRLAAQTAAAFTKLAWFSGASTTQVCPGANSIRLPPGSVNVVPPSQVRP